MGIYLNPGNSGFAEILQSDYITIVFCVPYSIDFSLDILLRHFVAGDSVLCLM